MRRSATQTALLSAFLLAATSACNSEGHLAVVPVEGKVTLDGKPLTRGSITFQPAVGPMANGEIEADGTYHLTTYGGKDGAVLGDHIVSVVSNDGKPGTMPGTPGYVEPKSLIPEKYNDPTTSLLTAKVTKETKVINFDLK